MSLNNTLKQIILADPQNISNRSEALIHLFLTQNSYRWANGELVLNGPAPTPYKVSDALSVKAQRLISSMVRVNEKEAAFLEREYKKAQKKESAALRNIISKVDIIVKDMKSVPRLVQKLSPLSPGMNVPYHAKDEYRDGAIEALAYYLEAYPKEARTFAHALALIESV